MDSNKFEIPTQIPGQRETDNTRHDIKYNNMREEQDD